MRAALGRSHGVCLLRLERRVPISCAFPERSRQRFAARMLAGALCYALPSASPRTRWKWAILPCVGVRIAATVAEPARGWAGGQAAPGHVQGAGARVTIGQTLRGDRRAILWKLERKVDGSIIDTKLHECADSEDCVRSVFLSHERVVVGAADNTLRVYPFSSSLTIGAPKVLSSGHAEGSHMEGRINCVCCSTDDSNLFVTGGSDDAVLLWDGGDAPSRRRALCRMPIGGYVHGGPQPLLHPVFGPTSAYPCPTPTYPRP